MLPAVFVVALLAASAQTAVGSAPSVWGTIYHLRLGKPVTQTGDRVLLYDNHNVWVGPAFTDDQGVYTFYGLKSDEFPATIVINTNAAPFKRTVHDPGKVENIILPT